MDLLRATETATASEEEDLLLLSECSSGCESGWTVYLDELDGALSEGYATCGKTGRDDAQEEEDSMSTLSDASSGPPVFPADTDGSCSGYSPSCRCCYYLGDHREYCCCSCRCAPHSSIYYCHSLPAVRESGQGGKRRRRVQPQEQETGRFHQRLRDLLEDTATSPPPIRYAQPTGADLGHAASAFPLAGHTTSTQLPRCMTAPTTPFEAAFSAEGYPLSSIYMDRTNSQSPER